MQATAQSNVHAFPAKVEGPIQNPVGVRLSGNAVALYPAQSPQDRTSRVAEALAAMHPAELDRAILTALVYALTRKQKARIRAGLEMFRDGGSIAQSAAAMAALERLRGLI